MDDEAPESMRILSGEFVVISCGNSFELLIEFKFITSFLLYREPVKNLAIIALVVFLIKFLMVLWYR